MLKDITLGQYYPADSVIHRLDPRVKLFSTILYIVALFLVNNIWGWDFSDRISDLYDRAFAGAFFHDAERRACDLGTDCHYRGLQSVFYTGGGGALAVEGAGGYRYGNP